ncbi:MAG: amino acid-binding protein [Promethearchaeota archaeon]
MAIKQLSVFLPNKPGELASFFEFLMDNKIFIRSLTVAETEEYGLLLLLVDKPEKCALLLEENNYIFSVTKVIAVRLNNNISDLYKIAKLLGSNKINIEYLYFLILDGSINGVVLKLNDIEGGANVLKKNGFTVIETFD